MDNYKRISVRFNLDRSDHKKAWDVLSNLPQGMMNEYITSSIINADNEKRLKRIVKECMCDVFEECSLDADNDNRRKSKQDESNETSQLDGDALDFIKIYSQSYLLVLL